MTTSQTLPKAERLCSKNTIDALFTQKGESFVHYPFRIVYLMNPEQQDAEAAVMVSVSKKRFKRANKRNLLKRRIREAYRLNKSGLNSRLAELNLKMGVAFLYLPKEIQESAFIHRKMAEALEQLIHKLT